MHNKRFGIPLDYDRMLEYYAYYVRRAYNLKKRVCGYTNPDGAVDRYRYKDADFKNFLRKAGVSTGLIETEKGDISCSAESLESAVATGLYSEEVSTVMKLYSEAKSCESRVNVFTKILDQYNPVGIETWDNHRMIVVRPDWVPQNTGRLGTQNPATINFAKEVGDIFTVPKGYLYFVTDSGQIEPRLTQSWRLRDPQLNKCTMMYNDAYFGYLHYCTFLTPEQRRAGALDLQPVEITDEMKAKRQKFKTFGNAVMYGSTENLTNDPDKAAFIRYIGGHPNRIKLQREIEDAIDRGERVFCTAFGTQIDITNGPSEARYRDKSSSAYRNHLVRCAINAPMQGTAADLMRYSVNKANILLRDKAPNSIILQYVHDAGKFMINEKEYEGIRAELEEIVSYHIEDWIPIYSGVEVGIQDSSLERLIA